jgi:N-formylglutamate amidohydrolase
MGVTTRDTNTIELAQAAARRLEHVTGARPSMVVAQFDRLYVDANRALDEAIESPIARPVYDDYHASLRGLVEATRQRFPNGALLVDLHGQALMRGHLMRGTRDGLTVTRMLERHGAAALVGPGSVLGRLASGGYPVEPPNTPPPTPREERFNGGYIVAAYGSQHADGIDAIKVEVGSDFRLTAMPREALAVALGDALAWFAAVYLGIASPAFGGRDLRPASFRSHGGSIATGVAAVG